VSAGRDCSRVSIDVGVLEVGFDAFGGFPDRVHVGLGRGFELGIGAIRDLRADGLFEVGVEPFIRIQLGCTVRQVEDLEAFAVLSKPGIDRLRMMDTQVVEDQESLAVGVIDLGFENVDEPVGIEKIIYDHQLRHPSVRYGGDQRQYLLAARRIGDGSLTFGSIAPASHVGVDECGLVAPMDFGAFGFHACRDCQISWSSHLLTASRCYS
jgi:hypothetical protein